MKYHGHKGLDMTNHIPCTLIMGMDELLFWRMEGSKDGWNHSWDASNHVLIFAFLFLKPYLDYVNEHGTFILVLFYLWRTYMQFIVVVDVVLCCFAPSLTVISNHKPWTLENTWHPSFVHVLLARLISNHTLEGLWRIKDFFIHIYIYIHNRVYLNKSFNNAQLPIEC